ncbi:MAG: 30S ribosome-binding factor RbfA [Erysipelotrichales bacterium]|nr:30S ribosome-binding factor RbfA [Erysipelotrichales bacterium]
MSVKIERISSEVLRVLSEIMLLEAKDETLKHITITDCVVTNDLSFANVYYTYMGDEPLEDVKKNLEVAAPYLRTVLASKIELRHTPELRFFYDESIEYGQNIERIINKLHENEKE